MNSNPYIDVIERKVIPSASDAVTGHARHSEQTCPKLESMWTSFKKKKGDFSQETSGPGQIRLLTCNKVNKI